MKKQLMASVLGIGMMAGAAHAQDGIELHGASQFNEEHAFTRSLMKFGELLEACASQPVNIVYHNNSSLGLEKQYFEYMSEGRAVDFAIVSPAHMSTFSRAAPFIDAPFLFRDHDHWNAVLEQDLFKPISDELAERADVMLIGYAGGGTRNIFATRPLETMEDLQGLKVRVQGAPIWSSTFQAAGMAPTVIAYDEVYNGIQNGVIEAGENEAAGVEQMRFYEVGPQLALTNHAITVRPIAFSGQTFRNLDEETQACVLEAGAEAGAYGREIESSEDAEKLDALEEQGLLTKVEFQDRQAMQEAVAPIMAEYAEEIGASEIFEQINAIE